MSGESFRVHHAERGKPLNRCLGHSPGAKQMGWAVVSNPHDKFEPRYRASGVLGLARKDEGDPEYKLRLAEYFSLKAEAMIMDHLPVVVVNKIQPTQSDLAETSAIIFQASAFASNLTVAQFESSMIKKELTGNQRGSKVKVRDAVIDHFPELADRKKDWQAGKEGFDECDAIAVCLTYFRILKRGKIPKYPDDSRTNT